MDYLGKKVRDTITGFEGVVVGHVEYLTGCAQVGVQPPAKDGEMKSAQYFDVTRIEVIGESGFKPAALIDDGTPMAGGPNRDAPPT